MHEYGRTEGKPLIQIHGITQCYLVWSKQYRTHWPRSSGCCASIAVAMGCQKNPLLLSTTTRLRSGPMMFRQSSRLLALHRPSLVGWSYGGFIINDYRALYGTDAVREINYVCAGLLSDTLSTRTPCPLNV